MSRSGKRRGCEKGLGRGIWILGDFLAVEFCSVSVSALPLGKQGLVMAT